MPDVPSRDPADPTQNVMRVVDAESRRQDELRAAEMAHLHEVAEIRERYGSLLRTAETARIDAIRAVDVGAVNRAAEVSATQAQALAAQVAQSAETLRGQVEVARQQTAAALAAALDPIQKDIADLRRAQYEAQGSRIQVDDRRSSTGLISGIALGGFALVLTMLGLAVAVLTR